jgi:hypothetical protein
MRVVCPECGGRTAIARQVIESPTRVELYGQCRNVSECGAVSVHTLEVSRLLLPPALELPPLDVARLAMAAPGRLFCPYCGDRAGIEKRQNHTRRVADLYCRCQGRCGARFVSTLGFLRYTQPPIRSVGQLAASVIRSLPRQERERLTRQGDLWG